MTRRLDWMVRFNWSILKWWEWVLLYTLVAWRLSPTVWLAWLGVPTGWPWPNTVYCVLLVGLMVKVVVRNHRTFRVLRSQRGSDEIDPRRR